MKIRRLVGIIALTCAAATAVVSDFCLGYQQAMHLEVAGSPRYFVGQFRPWEINSAPCIVNGIVSISAKKALGE
jgi:hypothetical protein